MALDDDTTTTPPATPPPDPKPGDPGFARFVAHRIEAQMAGNAPDAVKRYKIAGASGGARELERYSPDELLRLLAYWRARAAAEDRAASGRPRPSIRYSI